MAKQLIPEMGTVLFLTLPRPLPLSRLSGASGFWILSVSPM